MAGATVQTLSVPSASDLKRQQIASGFTAPAGTATLFSTGVMAGIGADANGGGQYVAQITGRIRILIMGNISNGTAGDGGEVQLSYGLVSAGVPAANGAKAGTQVGAAFSNTISTAAGTSQFAVEFFIQVAIDADIWVDLLYGAVTGGTATLSNLQVIIEEY